MIALIGCVRSSTVLTSPSSPTSSPFPIGLLGLALGVPLDVLLIGPRYAQTTGRNVLGDHRTGTSVCAVADFYGRNQCGVDPGLGVAADLCAVFAETVVVGNDRARNEKQRAIQLYSAAIGVAPQDAELVRRHMDLLLDFGDYSAALEHCDKLLERDPEDAAGLRIKC